MNNYIYPLNNKMEFRKSVLILLTKYKGITKKHNIHSRENLHFSHEINRRQGELNESEKVRQVTGERISLIYYVHKMWHCSSKSFFVELNLFHEYALLILFVLLSFATMTCECVLFFVIGYSIGIFRFFRVIASNGKKFGELSMWMSVGVCVYVASFIEKKPERKCKNPISVETKEEKWVFWTVWYNIHYKNVTLFTVYMSQSDNFSE